MSEATHLPCVEVEPRDGIAVKHSVIWLHGLGADGHDFEPVVPHLGLDDGLGVRFVFPHAPKRPVTLNAGMVMPAWYDIQAIDLRRDHDEAGIADSAQHIRALIARENQRGVPTERIVLAGFSQGGAMALYVGLRYPQPLAGILALSCYLILEDRREAEATDANRETKIFQAHGELDPMVPLDRGSAAHARLVELGYDVEWKTYTMGHEVHAQEIRDIGGWLRQRLT